MSKARLNTLKERLKSAEAFAKGELELKPHKVKVKVPDVKKIRTRAKFTQTDFAALFGWSVDTVRSWESGRRVPDQSARMLLLLFAKDPEYLLSFIEEECGGPQKKVASGR